MSHPELEIKTFESLSVEQQNIYLLNFVSTLTKYICNLSPDECSAQQILLKKELFRLLNLPSHSPSRVIRYNLGRCFAHILGNGDRKLLFEIINELNTIVGNGKNKVVGDLKLKHAAIHCLGDIFAAAGDSAIQLHPLVCTSLLKTLKVANNNAGLRAAIFGALGKIVGIIGASFDEVISRDVWKQGRSYAASDKAALVQISACRSLSQYIKNTVYFENSHDLEHLKSSMLKAIDSPSSNVRIAAAECLADALVKSYSELPVNENDEMKPKKMKWTNSKKQKGQGENIDETQRSEITSPRKEQILVFSLSEILKQLSTFYIKNTINNNTRAGIALCYLTIFQKLREKSVEALYMKAVDHLINDVLSHTNITSHRYRLLTTRKFVKVILEDVIGASILSDEGQINAATHLINNYLKNFPQVIKEKAEPSKHTLVVALSALASLIRNLGTASNSFSESCRDCLLKVLQHPNYTVQVYTSYCLRELTLACPQQLIPCLSICMSNLDRELNLIGTGRICFQRCVSYANGLSAMISTSSLQPLYGSVDVNSHVLSLATSLLKSSSKSEIRVSSTQIQVAWILIGGLMSLGPNFVKIHLPQLLLLWKNALPKPLKENISQRSYFESYFLTHVRECALASILAFLQFNSRLLTVDVSKRITVMLQNTTSFLKNLPSKKFNDDVTQRLIPSLQLYNLEQMTWRRVLQCYIRLVNLSPGGKETLLQSNILTLAVSLFADPEDYSPSSLSTSIANSAGTFETIWDVGDNYGYGVTGLVRMFKIRKLDGEHQSNESDEWIEKIDTDAGISQIIVSPICQSLEHDSLSVFLRDVQNPNEIPDPPTTEVVNVAIQLFATAFPLMPSKVQESILEQITTFLSSGLLLRDPGRKAAMNINIATAILCTLKVAAKETSSPPGDITNSAVEKLMQNFLHQFVIHPDQYLRRIGYEGLAKLCKISGSSFTNTEIKYLVDTIVSNREPSARAGCAKALGSIHSQVGNMAAGYHLKTIINILMSLCNDPHPAVHFWALDSLSRVAESAGYNFSGYVLSSLGMLGQLYVADTHNEEVPSTITSNLELELPTSVVVARCINSIVNVIGPDLQDISKPRELILTLVSQLQHEENPLVHAGSLRCLEHLSLYAPKYVIFLDYVRLLQKDLNSPYPQLRDIAIDGLYYLMKRNSEEVVKAAEEGFEDQLWLALDSAPNHEGIKNVIKTWLQQSCLNETSRWLQRCQNVLSMSRPNPSKIVLASTKPNATPDLRDEEVAGFAAASGVNKDEAIAPAMGQEPLRWQVRTFAMSCLGELFFTVSKADSDSSSPAMASLQKNVADVIRMAFSASTSNLIKLRVWGLKIIDAVLKMFGKTPDPDFAEASLLEQFQAQISSALTPAFAADSSPELASEAVNVCAAFIATGIVTDVERMGRILKTLVTALENFSTGVEVHTIGELKGLSSNAQVMIKLAVFSAWAELQVASTEQKYLIDVLRPHIGTLTPMWLALLTDFARLRFEPDISMTLGPPSLSGSLDSIYSALNRETLLKFYQESWLKLVGAIASLIEQDCEFVFDALDDKKVDVPNKNDTSTGIEINYRDEPVAFFFVLFGITFESLATRPGSDLLAKNNQILETLQVLKKILHPSVSGHAIYKEAIFSETLELLDRFVLTEGLDVQRVIVQIGRGLCISHPFAKKAEEAEEEDLSEDIEQLFELTRIIVLVLAGLLPNLTETKKPAKYQLTDEARSLISISLSALVDAAEVFPSIIKTDLHACIIHIFATILGTASCQASVVPESLPILKRFISIISTMFEKNERNAENSILQIRSCLKRFLTTLSHAQKRESDASLTCVKNCLLASTILLTSGKNQLPVSESVVTQFLDETLGCLNDRTTAKVAANCLRSFLLQMPKTKADQSISRYLLPRLITFVTNTEDRELENVRPLIMHTLTIFVSTLSGEAKLAAISLVLPTLLSRAIAEGPSVYKETSARLLDLASIDQDAFRSIVARINDKQKQFMESVIIAGRQDKASENMSGDSSEGKRPAIALRMNFGE
ncbi:Pof6 interactor protein 1 [Golovinomyces cichoracearum]|uniref:Pof6 interactor protein 1 n=1 Tax=Golovinomyces cichoracearum TaxID=62708 RepID=A0A420IBR2_9PEZI|nr:Pof6 interactor protein 1 [Golovinomyces cichoracearum]